MTAVATQLYHKLVEALRERGADSADRPVTVAEIYQELVPYRVVRERLGLELNADYEHALLQLLAGEADLLRLEPGTARDELREELSSPNPYVGLYRKFAACDVWVKIEPSDADTTLSEHQDQIAQSEPAPTAAVEQTKITTAENTADAAPELADEVAATEPDVTATTAMPQLTEPTKPAASALTPEECLFCHEEIPAGRTVRFCPHCGGDQRSHPCGRCGEVLDHAWRYCIACGAAAASNPTPGAAH
jgi:hypothetical protein